MKRAIYYIMSRITMYPAKRPGFCDVVTGEYVRFWQDCYGNKYLAVRKFGIRMKLEPNL